MAFYWLYGACQDRGLDPITVGKMTPFQVASALRTAAKKSGATTATPSGKPRRSQQMDEAAFRRQAMERIRARVAASEGRGPAPEASATHPDDISSMMNALNA